MQTEIENEARIENDPNMVVVGRIAHRTDTHIGVVYPSESGQSVLVVNRKDINTTPSTGLSLPNTPDRIYGFTQAVCASCNNEASARRQIVFSTNDEGEEIRTTVKCPTCLGKGHITDFTNGHQPVIDDETQAVCDEIAQGNLPHAYTPAFQSMFKGGRNGIMDEWDCEITALPLHAMSPSGEFVPVSPAVIQHFNQSYATEDNPLGALIGRTKTSVYATKQHREMLEPFIAHCDTAGLRYNLWGANKGQDAYMDILLAENGTRNEVMSSLRDLRASGDSDMDFRPDYQNGIQDPRAVIKFGIQIHHSFDGSFTVRGFAERVACLNGMVATDAKNLLAVQHKKGVMDALDFTALIPVIIASAMELYDEMLEVDAMNDLAIDHADFESILVLAQERGLITFPSIGKNNQLTGGRVFRATCQGWADPSLPWVAVGQGEGDNAMSLNHAYNLFTGAFTHQVEANDTHGRVTGGKAISVPNVQKSLMAVHRFMREIQNSTYEAARSDGCSTVEDISEWVAFNGHPMLNDVAHAHADEGHILPRITVNMGQDTERTVQLTSRIARPMVA